MVAAAPLAIQPYVNADRYDDQINALQGEIDQYQAEASKLQNVANNLEAKLQSINLEKKQLQKQIDIQQTKYEKLKQQIKDNEKKIADNQDALGVTIADLYVDDTISPLEMLASSSNIGDYVDKQTYRTSMQDSLSQTIETIKKLKEELEEKKRDVAKVLSNQKNARKRLVAKESEQQTILAKTRGKQDAYKALSAKAEAEQVRIRKEQQEALAAAFTSTGGTLIVGGLAGGYPWNDSNCSMGGPGGYYSYGGADGNGGDGKGYGCRQCVSYVAWRVAKETGVYPISWGNAADVPASARAAGYQTGGDPRPGSIAVMGAYKVVNGVQWTGPEGHVGWVEAVNGDTLVISQYNYDYGEGYGMYSRMNLSKTLFDEYVYIK